MSNRMHSYIELNVDVEYDYTPADPGNPDIESRTCCPPSDAYVEITSVKIASVEILPVLTPGEIEALEEEALQSHDDGGEPDDDGQPDEAQEWADFDPDC